MIIYSVLTSTDLLIMLRYIWSNLLVTKSQGNVVYYFIKFNFTFYDHPTHTHRCTSVVFWLCDWKEVNRCRCIYVKRKGSLFPHGSVRLSLQCETVFTVWDGLYTPHDSVTLPLLVTWHISAREVLYRKPVHVYAAWWGCRHGQLVYQMAYNEILQTAECTASENTPADSQRQFCRYLQVASHLDGTLPTEMHVPGQAGK